jgi:sarcosine oxidase
MADPEIDIAVVGLGALGSATLYHLADLLNQSPKGRKPTRLIGIDAHTPPHQKGSHHGDTRITRVANGEGETYTVFAKRSHFLWKNLEKRSGQKLFDQRGVLVFGDPDSDAAMHGQPGFFRRTCALAKKEGIPHELLNANELQRRFPGFCYRPTDWGYPMCQPSVRPLHSEIT